MEIQVLYEDENIVAVNKPAGIMTHADGRTDEPTLVDWFEEKYPGSKDVGETQRLQDGTEITRSGVVHRLDRDTSGVLVFVKTQEAHTLLKEAFKSKEAKKTYLAFVYGVPKERKGTIALAIGRSRKDFRLRSAQRKAKGTLREAITNYEVLSDIGTHALLYVRPLTGRTHQIRVHLKAIFHPIVSDPLYAPNHTQDLGITRLGLHAYSLEIPIKEGEMKLITAPVPPDLSSALAQFPGTEGIVASA